MNLCIPRRFNPVSDISVQTFRVSVSTGHSHKNVFPLFYHKKISMKPEKQVDFFTIFTSADVSFQWTFSVLHKSKSCKNRSWDYTYEDEILFALSTTQWIFILHFFILINAIITDWSGKKSWKQKRALRFLHVLRYNWRTNIMWWKSFLKIFSVLKKGNQLWLRLWWWFLEISEYPGNLALENSFDSPDWFRENLKRKWAELDINDIIMEDNNDILSWKDMKRKRENFPSRIETNK